MSDKNEMKILTEDQVVARLRAIPESQTTIARELHCSRTFVNQVLKSRRSRPTNKMLQMVGIEKRTIYVEAGTFPEEYAIPGSQK